MHVLSHQISSHLPPKITPKPHFWGPFNAKPIILKALHQSHVNGATTLKLYGYIGIGKYLGVCQKGVALPGCDGGLGLRVGLAGCQFLCAGKYIALLIEHECGGPQHPAHEGVTSPGILFMTWRAQGVMNGWLLVFLSRMCCHKAS